MRISRALIALALVGAVAAATRADVIHLKNGTQLEGRVEAGPTPEQVTVRTRYGPLTIPSKEIASIETRRTRDEELQDREKATDLDDPDALLKLAQWCRANDLPTDALGYEARARKRRLELKLASLEDGDADALYGAAAWAEANDYDREIVDRLLRRALLADPERAKTRVAAELRDAQQKLDEDRKEAERLKSEARSELEAARRERDRVDMDKRLAESRLEEARALSRDVERERARLSDDQRRLDNDRAYVERQLRDLERDRDQAQRALSDAERARAEAEATRAATARLAAQYEARLTAYERDRLIAVCPRCGWKIVK